MMMFRLKRDWTMPDGNIVNLWDEIVSGRKTVEYREANAYWWKRLLNVDYDSFWSRCLRQDAKREKIDVIFNVEIYPQLVPKEATFTVGYPKNNLPRIESKTRYVAYLYKSDQLATGFKEVVVVQ